MFEFKNRRINRIGHSYVITLPIDWVRNLTDTNSVSIKMNNDGTLVIVPATPCQDGAGTSQA